MRWKYNRRIHFRDPQSSNNKCRLNFHYLNLSRLADPRAKGGLPKFRSGVGTTFLFAGFMLNRSVCIGLDFYKIFIPWFFGIFGIKITHPHPHFFHLLKAVKAITYHRKNSGLPHVPVTDPLRITWKKILPIRYSIEFIIKRSSWEGAPFVYR